jgi:hypothetical protein
MGVGVGGMGVFVGVGGMGVFVGVGGMGVAVSVGVGVGGRGVAVDVGGMGVDVSVGTGVDVFVGVGWTEIWAEMSSSVADMKVGIRVSMSRMPATR